MQFFIFLLLLVVILKYKEGGIGIFGFAVLAIF